MSASNVLHPGQFGWRVDTDAPSYYPDNLAKSAGVVHPDDELTATQKDMHGPLEIWDQRKAAPVDIVMSGGVSYINDGHHRLAMAKKAGKPAKANYWFDPDEEL